VPSVKWRNAMTLPRDLSLKQENGEIYVASTPVKELKDITLKPVHISPEGLNGKDIFSLPGTQAAQYSVKYTVSNLADYSMILSNDEGDKLVVGFDKTKNGYYIDRTKSGVTGFNPDFARAFFAPRLTYDPSSNVELVIDASSVELFADNGLTVMTCVFFSHKPYNHLKFQYEKPAAFKNISLLPLKSIW